MPDNVTGEQPQLDFSEIGFDVPMWLQNKLIEYDQFLRGLVVDRDPPGIVGNIALTRNYPGIQLTWTPATKAARYLIYRNTANSFALATLITVLPGIENVAYFDVTTGLSPIATIYYFIVAQNTAGISGPVAESASVANSVAPAVGQIDDAANGELILKLGVESTGWPAILALGDGADDDVTVWSAGLEASSYEGAGYTFP